MRMGPILSFFFKDRFDMRGWEIFPSRMSFAEVGFVLFGRGCEVDDVRL